MLLLLAAKAAPERLAKPAALGCANWTVSVAWVNSTKLDPSCHQGSAGAFCVAPVGYPPGPLWALALGHPLDADWFAAHPASPFGPFEVSNSGLPLLRWLGSADLGVLGESKGSCVASRGPVAVGIAESPSWRGSAWAVFVGLPGCAKCSKAGWVALGLALGCLVGLVGLVAWLGCRRKARVFSDAALLSSYTA